MSVAEAAKVHICNTPEAVAFSAAEAIVDMARAATDTSGRFTLALSGGQSPRPLYQQLATRYRDSMPWAKVHLFWGDDRFVPADDPESNYRMVRETLLDHVDLRQIKVHPMPVFFQDPSEAAADYEASLKGYWSDPWPRLDLMLLGIGADGHTASLYPRSTALSERQRWVVAVHEPTAEPPWRLTVTLPVINHAAHLYFIATGEEKAEVVAKVLQGKPDPLECPAAGVRPERGEVIWWLDEAAASQLKR